MRRKKAPDEGRYDNGADKHNGDTDDHGDEILNRDKMMKLAIRQERLHLFFRCTHPG